MNTDNEQIFDAHEAELYWAEQHAKDDREEGCECDIPNAGIPPTRQGVVRNDYQHAVSRTLKKEMRLK